MNEVTKFKVCKCGRPIPINFKRCKQCKKFYDQQHFSSNKAAKVGAVGQRRNEIIDWYRSLKESRCCVDCGGHFKACQLDFDHLPQYKKVAEVSFMVRNGYAKERIQEEIAKCEVRCKNCHALVTEVRRKNGTGL